MTAAALKHLAAADPVMARLIREAGPCRLAHEPWRSPFQSLVLAVAHQQLHATAAGNILGRFKKLFPKRRFPKPALSGAHQISNAGAALACLPLLKGFTIDDKAAARGLREVQWPARLQRLTRGPLAASLPAGWELWLDGGHNQAAGEALGEFIKGWADRPLHLVFGMLNTKEPVAFLKPLAAQARDLIAVRIAGDHASLSAEDAAGAAAQAGIAAEIADGVEPAVARIIARERQPSRILICGSLYLAGVVLETNG